MKLVARSRRNQSLHLSQEKQAYTLHMHVLLHKCPTLDNWNVYTVDTADNQEGAHDVEDEGHDSPNANRSSPDSVNLSLGEP